MKKIVTMILVLAMALSLCACAGGGEGDSAKVEGLQVGFGRENITPNDSVPLGGYGDTDKRMSTGYLDYLYATCVAVTDGKETVLFITQDLINSSQVKTVRNEVSKATGIPDDHIMLSATHTHSGPDQGNDQPVIGAWKTLYLTAMVKAAEAALADVSPAQMSVGRTDVEGMNFVRHYLMSDGTYAGSNFGTFDGLDIVDHAEEKDPEMQMIKFTRAAEDKKDILMVNWQAHPCVTGGNKETVISADFVGSTRTYVESNSDNLFIYFTGAAGNQNTSSKIAGEEPPQDYYIYGQMLGDYVLNLAENLTSVENGDVKLTKNDFVGQVNHEMEDKMDQALEVQELYKATDRATGNKLAREYGFSSVYHCNAIIKRSSMDATSILPLYAISIGDSVSFVTAPYEMFAAHSMYIKENTPFDMTFVLAVSNGSNGYIPTNKAFDYRCYESDTGKFARGTGDLLVEEFIKMLTELKG